MKAFTSLVLAGTLALSACASVQERKFENKLLEYSGETKLFTAEEFAEGQGAVIAASREEGIHALIERAKNDEQEISWFFLPEEEVWINGIKTVGDAKGRVDAKLAEYALSLVDEMIIAHTHTDAEYNSYYSQEEIESFGDSLYFIPTETDVAALLHNTNTHPEKKISSIIASSKGALSMECEVVEFPLHNMYTRRAFQDYAQKKFVFIREHFRGAPTEQLAERAAEYTKLIELAYIAQSEE